MSDGRSKTLIIIWTIILAAMVIFTSFSFYSCVNVLSLKANNGGEAVGVAFAIILVLPITIVSMIVAIPVSISGLCVSAKVAKRTSLKSCKVMGYILVVLSAIIICLIIIEAIFVFSGSIREAINSIDSSETTETIAQILIK